MKPVRKKIEQAVKKVKGTWWPNIAGPYSKRGVPDLTVICNGKVIFLEIKEEGDRPRKLQEYTIEMIRKNGGQAFFVDPNNVDEIIKDVLGVK